MKTRRAKLVLLAPNVAAIEDPPQPVAATSSEAAGVAKGEAADAAQPGEAAVAGGEACDAAGGGSSACPAAALATLAAEREVPLVFALSRQRMGKVRREGDVLVSCRQLAGIPSRGRGRFWPPVGSLSLFSRPALNDLPR